jgi:hypothetical protein
MAVLDSRHPSSCRSLEFRNLSFYFACQHATELRLILPLCFFARMNEQRDENLLLSIVFHGSLCLVRERGKQSEMSEGKRALTDGESALACELEG